MKINTPRFFIQHFFTGMLTNLAVPKQKNTSKEDGNDEDDNEIISKI